MKNSPYQNQCFDDMVSTHQVDQLCFTKFNYIRPIWYFPGWVGVGGGGSGWVGQIKIKDHLSPAEAETWAELGNRTLL